jgi:murein L,D-transpeptidase YafK
MKNYFTPFVFIFFMSPLTSTLGAESVTEGQPVMLASLESIRSIKQLHKIDLDEVLNSLNMRIESQPTDFEAQLVNSILMFKSGERKRALEALDRLINLAPDFHLAYLIRGDIRLSSVKEIKKIGNNTFLDQVVNGKKSQELKNLRDEARVRLDNVPYQPYLKNVPREILALGDNVSTAILVEKSRNRLYLYQRRTDGSLNMLHDYYVSTGKSNGNKKLRGDLKTPEGVYFITSFIPQNKLPDKYGVAAFPVNYPNELDTRLGKTGFGIWLHGTDSRSYSRPPLDSEGCVVLTNKDLKSIKTFITPGVTPVVISEKVTWLSPQQWQIERASLFSTLEMWRKDWQSMDVEQYLSHYGTEFWARGYNLRSWLDRKRMISKSKKFQHVNLSNISLLSYPLEMLKVNDEDNVSSSPIVVARFEQDYSSNNFNSKINKRLYLKRHVEGWKIVYEGR